MKGLHWVVVIVALVAITSLFAVVLYMNATEQIAVTSVVVEKYMYESTDAVINVGEDSSYGIPIKSMKYLLVLEDGTEHKVGHGVFVNTQIGNEFTYHYRGWK